MKPRTIAIIGVAVLGLGLAGAFYQQSLVPRGQGRHMIAIIDPEYEGKPSVMDLQQKIRELDHEMQAEVRWLQQQIDELWRRCRCE